jgi:acyl carrier protein phosphodiesterase
MNFLAHAYLSFGEEEILVGNMISDFLKGKAQYEYSPGIRKGIILHRLIDEYTDTHSAVKEAKEFFRPSYRLYSAPLIDIILDYYLANDRAYFKNGALKVFTQTVYKTLDKYSALLPQRFIHAFNYMQSEDWLFNYQFKEGIAKSIKGLVRRSQFLDDSTTAIELFNKHSSSLEVCYKHFFEDVKFYAKQQLILLNK